MTLLRARGWSGSLASSCAFAACAASGELGLPLLLAFPAALLGSHLFDTRAAGRLAWAWTCLLGGALLVWATQVVTGQLDLVLAATRFTLLLAIHRLWHRRGERDELLLLLLSLLLVCAAAALSAELLFGVAFFAYAVAATWALALTHLRYEIAGSRAASAAAALLESRRLATPALLFRLAVLAVLGMIGCATFFLAFPRVTVTWLRRGSGARHVAGLSDRVDLTGRGTLSDDPRIVLRVRLDPDPGRAQLDLHWRARALEVWTGRGWKPREGLARPVDGSLPGGFRLHARLAQRSTAEIEAVSGLTEGLLFAPEGLLEKATFPRGRFGETRYHLSRTAAGDLFVAPVELGSFRYAVTFVAAPAEPVAGPAPDGPADQTSSDSEDASVDLDLPADLDPRVRALSQRLTHGKDPREAALAVERYLAGGFRYTRELGSDGKDPLASFLFDRKAGHCELFSSAMVMILRAAGIPARAVIGYYGGIRRGSGSYAVRAGDAHSWVEVYLRGAGFVPFDPSPVTERGLGAGGAYARLLLLWDALSERWRIAVVDYDLLSQARALRQAGALLQEAGRRLSGRGRGIAAPSLMVRTALGAALCAAAAVVALRRRNVPWRFPSRGSALGPEQRRARGLWRRARARLRRAGIETKASAPAREVARHAAEAGAPEDVLLRLVSAHLASRWGEEPLSEATARRLLRELDADLRASKR